MLLLGTPHFLHGDFTTKMKIHSGHYFKIFQARGDFVVKVM